MPEYPVNGATGLVTKRYNVYMRAQAAYTAPTTQEAYDTLLGTFDGEGTPVAIGVLKDHAALVTMTPKTKVPVSGGRFKTTVYDGKVEIPLINVTEANQDYIESLMGAKVDVLFDDAKDVKHVIVLDCYLEIEEKNVDGEHAERILRLAAEVDQGNLTAFRDYIWYGTLTPPE